MEATPSLRVDRPRPGNVRARAAWLAAVLCAVAAPADTLARDVTLRFLPPADSEVSSYQFYAKDLDSGVEAKVDVGFVAPDTDGVARATVLLDDAITYRVQMTASNDYGTSPRSNEIVIQAAAALCDPALCDDGNPCTADWCDAAGCASAPVQDGTLCDDGYVDTVDDQCVQGICEGLLLTCRTDDECDDGNPCNGSETCGGPAGCLEGTPLYCGEPTACTAPGCTPAGECFTEVIPDGTPCDDGRADTGGDACLGGSCQGMVFDPGPGLALAAISPQVVFPGTQALEIQGAGFMPGAAVYFENGSGRPPKVKGLRLVNDGSLIATVDVGGGGPPRANYFDVRVELPDGRSAVLPQVLRIER